MYDDGDNHVINSLQMRLRRLQRVQQGTSDLSVATSSPAMSSRQSSATAADDALQPLEAKRNSSEALSPSEDISGSAGAGVAGGAGAVEDQSSSPQRKMTKSEPSPAHASATPSKLNSSGTLDPAAAEAIRAEREQRALNITLESALLVTFRREAATELIHFIGEDNADEGQLLNCNNFSEVVCNRLSDTGDILNAVSYLTGCYKRIMAKESAASSENLRLELVK